MRTKYPNSYLWFTTNTNRVFYSFEGLPDSTVDGAGLYGRGTTGAKGSQARELGICWRQEEVSSVF